MFVGFIGFREGFGFVFGNNKIRDGFKFGDDVFRFAFLNDGFSDR